MASTAMTFRLLGRDESASKALGKVASNAERTHRRFEGLGRALGGVAKIGGRLTLALGAAGAAGGLLGIKTAASMEQAKIAFETMLGSASKADVFLKNLADFAAKTPFEFPELQTAASSLISAGIEAGKVIPIMTTLGDVTSGMGTGSEGVKRATIALQQMSAAGRITGEDLNQLRDAGIPVFDLLAAATGKSKAEVVKLAQAGKLGAAELGQLMKALETGKGLERFSGLMEKQSRSLTGLWSTFKDTLGMGLAKLMAPAIPALKAGLGKVTGLTEDAFKAVSAFAEGVSTGSEQGLGGFLTTVSRVGAEVGNMVRVFKSGSDAIAGEAQSGFTRFAAALRKGVLDVVPKVIGVARKLTDAVKDWLPAVGAAAKAVGGALVLAFGAAMVVLPPLLDVLGALGRFFSEHKTLVTALAGGVLAIVTALKVFQVVAKTAVAVQTALNLVMALNPIGVVVLAIIGLGAALVIAYKKSETFRNIVNGAFRGVQKVLGDVTSFVLRGFRAWLTVWLTVADGIVSGAATALGWVPGVGDKLKSANKAFDRFRDDTLKTLDKMAAEAGEFGEKTARKIKEGFTKVIGAGGIEVPVMVTANGRIVEGLSADIATRARGGPLRAGQLALVGEEGPELIQPRSSVNVIPNGAYGTYGAGAAAGGSVVVVENVITLDGDVLYRAVQRRALRQGKRSIGNGLAPA